MRREKALTGHVEARAASIWGQSRLMEYRYDQDDITGDGFVKIGGWGVAWSAGTEVLDPPRLENSRAWQPIPIDPAICFTHSPDIVAC